MTNELLTHPQDTMERPHYTKPADLVAIAPAFIDFSYVDPHTQQEVPHLFVHDFTYAARELGYTDIEHGEALAILEDIKESLITEYSAMLKTEVDDIFDAVWLGQVPFDSVDEFIELYRQGECWDYIYERFDHLLSNRLSDRALDDGVAIQHSINSVHEDALNNMIPRRINTIIQLYQKNPETFVTRTKVVYVRDEAVSNPVEIKGEQNG